LGQMVLLPSLAILKGMPLGFIHLSKSKIDILRPWSIPRRATKRQLKPPSGGFLFWCILNP
jgi:hypothetical protein